jgi:hydroxymethylglutaryl-CoA reductase
LEVIAKEFEKEDIQIVMSILSNYVPECLVHAEVSCDVNDLYAENSANGFMSPQMAHFFCLSGKCQ